MKILWISALLLSLAACSESPKANTPGKAPSNGQGVAAQTTPTPVSLTLDPVNPLTSSLTLKKGELELTSTSLHPKMNKESAGGSSFLFGLKADFKLSGLGAVKLDLANASARIVTAQFHDCKLTTLEVSNPDAQGFASFNIEGIDDAAFGPCEKLIYDVFHEGAFFDFYGITLSGLPTGETKANLSLMMKPF